MWSQLNAVPVLTLAANPGAVAFGEGEGIFLVASNQSWEK